MQLRPDTVMLRFTLFFAAFAVAVVGLDAGKQTGRAEKFPVTCEPPDLPEHGAESGLVRPIQDLAVAIRTRGDVVRS